MRDAAHLARSPAAPSDGGQAAPARADMVVRRTTTATVLFLASVAGLVSYGHIHTLALRHGEANWTAALLPLSVDGMIIAASLALLTDSRHGRRGGILPWTLLVIASGASLCANVADADPTLISRVIAAWPPFALIGAYEMLMRQIRYSVVGHQAPTVTSGQRRPGSRADHDRPVPVAAGGPATAAQRAARQPAVAANGKRRHTADRLQRQAWQWALNHRLPTGDLPSGEVIADHFRRSPRWGRIVKNAGLSGSYGESPVTQSTSARLTDTPAAAA